MTLETTIPCLPCCSIDDTLTFYKALGFEVTYQQSRPNTYAVVQRNAICLHFFTLKLEPEDSYSTCIVIVPDVDELYQTFAEGLRAQYGKLPIAGIPRLTRLRDKSGGRGFNVIDPGGNWIRISQPNTASGEVSKETAAKADSTKLSRAISGADFLTETKADFATAAKMLDTALASDKPASNSQRVQALVLRTTLALNLNDQRLPKRLLEQMQQIELSDDEREALAEELQRATDLEALV
jgi:catechol 2,3-dioxygenase-like lactoylglutathione lyase family enzyme